jgi:phenylacetate-CoA ligase
MRVYTLADILENAREKSPFYKNLYKNCPLGAKLTDLPLTEQSEFWSALRDGYESLLTNSLKDGIAFKSGGTTGQEKYSFFSQEEWETFTMGFGWGMLQGAFYDTQKLANLFYAGDLYASFAFIMNSIENSPVKKMQFPLSGKASFEETYKTLKNFEIDTLAGVPTTLYIFFQKLREAKLELPKLKTLLYGGESFFEDQINFLREVMPDIEVRSIGYASVDAGLLGYASRDCARDEHRCFELATIMEIVDTDTKEVIHEVGRPGKLYVTCLFRKLMPIIRYPVGDIASWVEPAGTPYRKFKILGRSEEGARVGPVTLYFDDMWKVLHELPELKKLSGMQLRISHQGERDLLTIVLAVDDLEGHHAVSEQVIAQLLSKRSMLQDEINAGKIHRPKIEWVMPEDLKQNARTGKLLRVIDERFKR